MELFPWLPFGCYGSLFLVYLFVVMEFVFLVTCLLLRSLASWLPVCYHGPCCVGYLLVAMELFPWLPFGCYGSLFLGYLLVVMEFVCFVLCSGIFGLLLHHLLLFLVQ